MKCPECGTDNAETTKTCSNCGAELISDTAIDVDKMVEETIASGDDVDFPAANTTPAESSASLATDDRGAPMVARSSGGSPLYAAPTVSSTSDIPLESPRPDSLPTSPVTASSSVRTPKEKTPEQANNASSEGSSNEIVNKRTPTSRDATEESIGASFAAWGQQIKKNREYSGSEKRLNEVNSKLEANQKEYDRLNDIVARYPDNLKAQKNQLSALEGRSKSASEKAWDIRSTINADSSALMSLIETHTTQLSPLERDVATLTTAYETAQHKLETARKAKKDSEDNLKSYRAAYASAEKSLRKCDEQIEEHQGNLVKVALGDEGYDALQKKISETTVDHERYASEMASNELKIQSANETVATRDKDLLVEEQATTEVRKAYESAASVLETKKKEFAAEEKALKEKIARLEKEFATENENVAKTQKEITTCKKTIAEIEDIYANRDTYIPNLIKNIDVAKRQAESHTTNMSQLDEEKKAARARSKKAKLLVILILIVLIVVVLIVLFVSGVL